MSRPAKPDISDLVRREPERTEVASQTLAFTARFAARFGGIRVAGSVSRTPGLTEPGMSTQGGKLARQQITLKPMEGDDPALVVGWVEVPERRASLRSHQVLQQLHDARFPAKRFDLDRFAYEGFVHDLRAFFGERGYQLVEEDKPSLPAPSSGRREEPSSSRAWLWALVAMGVALGLLLAVALLRS